MTASFCHQVACIQRPYTGCHSLGTVYCMNSTVWKLNTANKIVKPKFEPRGSPFFKLWVFDLNWKVLKDFESKSFAKGSETLRPRTQRVRNSALSCRRFMAVFVVAYLAMNFSSLVLNETDRLRRSIAWWIAAFFVALNVNWNYSNWNCFYEALVWIQSVWFQRLLPQESCVYHEHESSWGILTKGCSSELQVEIEHCC